MLEHAADESSKMEMNIYSHFLSIFIDQRAVYPFPLAFTHTRDLEYLLSKEHQV